VLAAGVVLASVACLWKLHADSRAEYAHRVEWRDKALRYGVPVYPERPARVGLIGVLPFIRTMHSPRRETIVQVENEMHVGNLLRLDLARYPEGLVIMDNGISPPSRRQIAERFPTALIVDYPNMPE